MFIQDLPFIFLWWSVLFFLGAIFFPLTSKLFSAFVDRGYIFSKVLAIVILTYLVWVLGSLKLLPFSFPSLLLILILFLTGNLVFFFRKTASLKNIATKRTLLTSIFLEEIIFLGMLILWSFVKGHQPDLEGLEKYMDFGFINSLLRSPYFPPNDMWLAKSPEYAGHFINYYYFGHLTTAVLTKLSGINPAISYNLMLSSIFAFCFTCSFSLGLNFYARAKNLVDLKQKILGVKEVLAGLITGFLVTLGGNLHTLYAFTKGYVPADKALPFWQVLGWPINFFGYWYPNATRFIPYTIHEFPSYSFVVSDLHGHVLDIPFVLLTIALLFSYVLQKTSPDTVSQNSKVKNFSPFNFLSSILTFDFLFLLFLGFLLAVMYMTNAWDGAIYYVLCAMVISYLLWKKQDAIGRFPFLLEGLYQKVNFIPRFFFIIPLYLFFLGILLVLFSLPFQLSFKPFVSGIGVVRDHSAWWMLLILWGFFYYCVIGFAGILIRDIKILRDKDIASPVNILLLFMVILSTLLLAFPEFFYVKDIYPQHYRANTMFKLGYQAFIMLSLVSGYVINMSLRGIRRLKDDEAISKKIGIRLPSAESAGRNDKITKILTTIFKIILLPLIFLVSIYPYFSISSYFDNLKNYKGLYGLSYLENKYPDDYKAILWLGKNAYSPEDFYQPTILEAVGDSYTIYARVSANTGLPTVQGWPVHEWLWRGGYDEPGKRVEEVKKIYTSQNQDEVKNLLQKYNVKYVFVGTLEREKYPELNEENFKNLGTVVYTSGETRIYQIGY